MTACAIVSSRAPSRLTDMVFSGAGNLPTRRWHNLRSMPKPAGTRYSRVRCNTLLGSMRACARRTPGRRSGQIEVLHDGPLRTIRVEDNLDKRSWLKRQHRLCPVNEGSGLYQLTVVLKRKL